MTYAKKTKPALYLSLPSYRRKAVVKQVRRVRAVSDVKRSRDDAYRWILKEWWPTVAGTRCPVYPELAVADCHHVRGKAGPLYFDHRFFRAVSRKGHIWIDANRDKSRALGLLCKSGFNDMRNPNAFEKAYRAYTDGARRNLLHPNDTPPQADQFDLTDWEANQIRKSVDKETENVR